MNSRFFSTLPSFQNEILTTIFHVRKIVTPAKVPNRKEWHENNEMVPTLKEVAAHEHTQFIEELILSVGIRSIDNLMERVIE